MISVQGYLLSAAIYSISMLFGCFAGILLFKKASYFKSLFLGLAFTEIFIVFFYSAILTEGKTIFVLLIIPAILLILIRKGKVNIPFNKKNTGSLLIKAGLTILFGILFEQIFVNIHYYSIFTHATLPGLSEDYIYYSNLANVLNAYHIETTTISTSKDFLPGIEIYHYFDIWLTAFFIKISGLNAVCAYSTIVLPLLQFTVLLGIGAIIESWTKTEVSFWKFAKWAILFLLLSGISFWVPAFITSHFRFDVYSSSFLVTLLKLNVIYIGLVFSLLSISKNTPDFVYYITAGTMFLIISYTVLLPTFCVAYLFFILFQWFTDKAHRKMQLKGLGAFILFIFSCLLFMSVNATNSNTHNSILHFILPELKKTSFYIASSHILLLILLFTFFWFGIYFLSGFFILRNIRSNPAYVQSFVFLFCFFLSGAICWCLFHISANGVQLWSNVYLPVMNISTFLIVLLLIKYSQHSFRRYLAWLIIAFSLVQNIYVFSYTRSVRDSATRQFYSSLKALLTSHSSSSGIRASVLVDARPLQSFFARAVNIYHPLMELEAYFPYFFYDNLSVMEINFARTPDEERIILNSAFYQFIQKEKQENHFNNIPHSQFDFIKKYQIPYLIIGENATENPLLKKYYSTVLTSPDSDKFILLDKTLFYK